MATDIQTIAVNELATLLIPVNGKQLVLPNVTVAEIIPYMEPEIEDDVPNWYLGSFSWRNISVPLISFEAINDEPFESNSHDRRIAVLNGLLGDSALPFCGVVTQGVPRLMRVLPDELATDESTDLGPMEIARVIVSGENATIPNVDAIQKKILDFVR